MSREQASEARAQHRVSAITRHLCQASSPPVDAVVIGAGVVGLAVAKALAESGRKVVILEAADAIGTETSSRNSEVVHAGIYYPQGSLKAKLCVRGRTQLYAYCEERGVRHKRLGKILVASDESQLEALRTYQRKGHGNGVDLKWLEAHEAKALEPELRCVAALWSENTGIVDSKGLMAAYQEDAERHGAVLALNSMVVGGDVSGRVKTLRVRNSRTGAVSSLHARLVVNAAGLHAQEVARSLRGMPAQHIPERHLARGCYFALKGCSCSLLDGGPQFAWLGAKTGSAPFRHLIYPMPEEGGLGAHLTLDLAGQAKFGPDVEWVDSVDYTVNPQRAERFYHLIRHYWPGLPDGALSPAYSGIRPKLSGPGESSADFMFQGPEEHGVEGVINLFGFESPGLTASLAIGEHVVSMLGVGSVK